MQTLRLKHDYEESAVKFEGEFTDAGDVDVSLDSDTIVLGPDGSLQAILLCGVIPRPEHLLAYELWKDVNGDLSNRPKAVGVEATHRSTSPTGEDSLRMGGQRRVRKKLEETGRQAGNHRLPRRQSLP